MIIRLTTYINGRSQIFCCFVSHVPRSINTRKPSSIMPALKTNKAVWKTNIMMPECLHYFCLFSGIVLRISDWPVVDRRCWRGRLRSASTPPHPCFHQTFCPCRSLLTSPKHRMGFISFALLLFSNLLTISTCTVV